MSKQTKTCHGSLELGLILHAMLRIQYRVNLLNHLNVPDTIILTVLTSHCIFWVAEILLKISRCMMCYLNLYKIKCRNFFSEKNILVIAE